MGYNQLITNIKFLRKRKKLRQLRACEIIGIDRQLWSAWETRRSEPQTKELESLSQLFGITINDLVTEDMTEIEMYNKEWYAITCKANNP